MRNWRVLTAIAAVVLAALVGVLVWKYTDDAKNDAKKPFTLVTVLVADKRVPSGTTFSAALDGNLITRQQRVQQDLPDTRVLGEPDDATLKSQFKSLVASHDIVAGQTISSTDFVGQGQIQSSLGGVLENDNKTEKQHLEAITVSLDDQHAVGGFLQPGDRVNMLISGDVKDLANGDSSIKVTAFMIPGLKVLAVGATTAAPQAATAASGSSSSNTNNNATVQPRSLITVEVTPLQAEQIAQSQNGVGQLYLSLNPPSFKPGDFKDPGEIVEAVNLFRNPDGSIRDLPLVKSTLDAINARKKAS